MASAPARPARRPSPHARNSALLFIGYQPAPLAGDRSMDRALPVKNAVSTVRTTKTLGVPVGTRPSTSPPTGNTIFAAADTSYNQHVHACLWSIGAAVLRSRESP
jgi:hypothetical protein